MERGQYIFHEIEIQPEQIEEEKSYDGIPKLSEVVDLIKMYRLLQNNSEYTKIRHLLPTLQYTVLIDSIPSTIEDVTSATRSSSMIHKNRPRTVRLYFHTIPIYPDKIEDRLLPACDAIEGLGLDTVTNVEEGALNVLPQKIISSPTQGSSDFLRCFFIPYLTKHYVFCKVSLQQQQKQQKKVYQSKKNIFHVDSHESMKFFLSLRKISQQITDKHLIAGFAKHCPEKNIKKNGDPLTQQQQKQIQDLENQVDDIKRQCEHIIVQQPQSRPFPSSLSIRSEEDPPYLDEQTDGSNIFQPVHPSSFHSHTDSDAIPHPPISSLLQQKKRTLRSARMLDNDVRLITCLQDQIKQLQDIMNRQSGIGHVFVPTMSSSSYYGQVLLQGGGINRRIQKRQGSDPGKLMRELPEFSMLVKLDKETFESNFEQDILVLQKPPSHNYYKLASTDNLQRIVGRDIYRFISPGSLEEDTYEIVTNLESDDREQLNELSNDKILVQINIPSSVTQQQGVILSNTFPFQDENGSYDKIITQHGGGFLGGKYYQENPQQIVFEDNYDTVSPGNKFYKFISSKEFDPEKYSLVTSLSP